MSPAIYIYIYIYTSYLTRHLCVCHVWVERCSLLQFFFSRRHVNPKSVFQPEAKRFVNLLPHIKHFDGGRPLGISGQGFLFNYVTKFFFECHIRPHREKCGQVTPLQQSLNLLVFTQGFESTPIALRNFTKKYIFAHRTDVMRPFSALVSVRFKGFVLGYPCVCVCSKDCCEQLKHVKTKSPIDGVSCL